MITLLSLQGLTARVLFTISVPMLQRSYTWTFASMTLLSVILGLVGNSTFHRSTTDTTMQETSTTKTALQDTIDNGHFYSLSDNDILHQIQDAFPTELERLKDAYSMREPGTDQRKKFPASPSVLLYGQHHDEIDRTLVGVLSLRWLVNDQYETFVQGQPESLRLQRKSFQWLRALFLEHLDTPKDLFALVTATIINDLGKDHSLGRDYEAKTGRSVGEANHDTVLFEAAKAGMVPALDRLGKSDQEDLMLGLELGSELNVGQLAQAENVVGSLEGLADIMRGHERAFDLKYMEQLLDVAGAAGHSDPTCAKKMIEPVFQGFYTAYFVTHDIILSKCTLREGYDRVLAGRGKLLEQLGFRGLSVEDDKERALLKLLTMGRTDSKDQAELFFDTFRNFPEDERNQLIDGLNVEGHTDGMAILPYYMPAMFTEGLENTKDCPREHQEAALASLFRYLVRVYGGTKPNPQFGFGVIVEKNLMEARDTIASREFRDDPKILDNLEVPKGEVLRRRRTSNSSLVSLASPKGNDEATKEVFKDLLRQNSIKEETSEVDAISSPV